MPICEFQIADLSRGESHILQFDNQQSEIENWLIPFAVQFV